MRSNLTGVEGLSDLTIDLDNKLATFVVVPSLDVRKTLDELVENCNKLDEWSIEE